MKSVFVVIWIVILNSSDLLGREETCIDLKPHPNGGGLVAKTAYVDPSVFVGPNAKVCGRAKVYYGRIERYAFIGGDAEIERGRIGDNARVTGGKIEGGFIGGDAEIEGGTIASQDTKITGGKVKGGYVSGSTRMTGGTIEEGLVRDAKIRGGIIARNAMVTGGTIEGGYVGGFARFSGGRMEGGTLDGHARVSGGVIKEGSKVGGKSKISGGTIFGEVGGDAEVKRGIVDRDMKITSGTFSPRMQYTPPHNTERETIPVQTVENKTSMVESKTVEKLLKMMPWFKKILAVGTIAYEILTGDVEAKELPARLADESMLSTTVSAGDLPVTDYLDNLKIAAQRVNETAPLFSEDRQRLRNQLNTVYTDIQEDPSLSYQERQEYLQKIAEIQDIVQPPNPPRNPPTRRDQHHRSQGILGEHQPTNNSVPLRGIAGTSQRMCLDPSNLSQEIIQILFLKGPLLL